MTGKVYCSVSHSLCKISLLLWSHNRIVPCFCREFGQLFTKASDSNIILLLIRYFGCICYLVHGKCWLIEKVKLKKKKYSCFAISGAIYRVFEANRKICIKSQIP